MVTTTVYAPTTEEPVTTTVNASTTEGPGTTTVSGPTTKKPVTTTVNAPTTTERHYTKEDFNKQIWRWILNHIFNYRVKKQE